MCITFTCRICGEQVPLVDLRRTVCDKPECQAQRRKYTAHPKTPAKKRFCRTCGKEIPMSKQRFQYCKDCNPKNKPKKRKLEKMIGRKIEYPAGPRPRGPDGRYIPREKVPAHA